MIRVYDSYGRELFITKEEWRKNILPGTIQGQWNNANNLYGIIITALNDGFRPDVVAAAEQLYKIDPDRTRGACVWGIVLMEEERLNEAEKVLRSFTSQHGENGSILTNLAKVYARRKDDAKAEELLWRALEVDPNMDNGLLWYAVIHRERGGEEAELAAFRRVAALPKSWRAQLWLARAALKRRDLPEALQLYQQSLAAAPLPTPSDLLMQISGDLGNAGHLPELVNLVLPRFNVAFHGLEVGNNLIKAMSDLGQIESARKILGQLYAQNRPDWKATLSFWDTELAKLHVEATPVQPQDKLEISMLTIDGPVWLPEQSPAQELFPPAAADAVRVAFLGGSAEMPHTGDKPMHQMSDAPGRLSRALPLFLAEQVRFASDAAVRTLIAWLHGENGAFVFSGFPWKDSDAAQYARIAQPPSDYVVVTHLKVKAEPWGAELRLLRTIDAKCLATAACSFPSAQPEQGLQPLAQQLVASLVEHADVTTAARPMAYQVPRGGEFPYYLLRLEQLVAVRCAGMEGVPAGFLSGTHEILDGNLQLCLNNPKSVSARFLLLQTCRAMKRAFPEVVASFHDKLSRLQRENPLPQPAQGIAERLLNDACGLSTQQHG
jgi:tetratricopeptide (TPR) repeat protein